MYEIDDDVPVPPISARVRRTYPFADMKIGQSFFVPADGDSVQTVRRRILNAARQFRLVRKTGRFIAEADTTEGGVPGVRCWRVE